MPRVRACISLQPNPILRPEPFTRSCVSFQTYLARSLSSKVVSDRLKNRTALVTGSSSGVGRAIALAFASHGAKFVLCADLKPRKSSIGTDDLATHELIRQQYGVSKAAFVETNVTAEGDVENAVLQATEQGRRDGGRGLDIIVNNAGIGFESTLMHELDPQAWDKMMNVNLRSVFLGNKYACSQFLKQDIDETGHRGWIVNISSGAGLKGVAGGATAYCASKGGVVAFTRAVAVDYAEFKIHSNAICPGYLKTPMTTEISKQPEFQKQVAAQTPWGGMGNPEDIAKAVVFLASEDAAWVTGVPLPVDGGFAAG